jgi:hypothetical protein
MAAAINKQAWAKLGDKSPTDQALRPSGTLGHYVTGQ